MKRKNHKRMQMVRELWANAVDPAEIQRIVSAGDPDNGIPKCDLRTVRTYIREIRDEAERADAENLPRYKAQLRAVLRKNMSRAVRVYNRGITGGQLMAAGRGVALVNAVTRELAELDGLTVIKIEPVGVGAGLGGAALPDLKGIPPEVRAAILAVAKAARAARAKKDGSDDDGGAE